MAHAQHNRSWPAKAVPECLLRHFNTMLKANATAPWRVLGSKVVEVVGASKHTIITSEMQTRK